MRLESGVWSQASKCVEQQVDDRICRLLFDSGPRTPDSRRIPPDFFGFFGALKKGEFFGVHPKKVPQARSPQLGASDSSVSEAPLRVELMASRHSTAGVSRTAGHSQREDFFGVHTKKVPSTPMAEQESPVRPMAEQKNPASKKFSDDGQKIRELSFVERARMARLQVESRKLTGTAAFSPFGSHPPFLA
jgi:hypothetical protein